MAFSSPSSSDKELSEINIIPLVDIMLVLLIIFMVAAPLMNDSVQVQLPKAQAKPAEATQDNVELAIKADQSLYIGKTPIEMSDLDRHLKQIFENREKKEIWIRADETVPHGFIIKVMARIQRVGAFKISFLTDPVEEK